MKETKKCGGKYGCGNIKQRNEFHFSNKEKGYLQPECKNCRNKRRRGWTQKRIEEYNIKNKIVDGVDICRQCNKVKSVDASENRFEIPKVSSFNLKS